MAGQLEVRRRLRDDFEFYAPNCLQIRSKEGSLLPFKLNSAQRFIHKAIEDQRERTGKVRAIILKGRQQGCSTYVEGRYYWRTSHRKGARAFILTHEAESTSALFEMTERFHDHCPDPVKPMLGASNAKELVFEKLDSGYKVGTAGNKSVGRGTTIQYFHGSEVGFWPNASEHVKGILQAVPDEDETEVILESTANGVGNFFHTQWKAAETGETEYIAIFVPWFWQDEYRKTPPADFVISEKEESLAETYGLDREQLYWRRQKISELGSDGTDGERAFMQEYPCNAAEAFQITGGHGLITPDVVLKARKAQVVGSGPVIVGVDPSRGGDRFSVVRRQGRRAYGVKSWRGNDVETLGQRVAICKKILDEADPISGCAPAMMFIDSGGGADMVDRLIELGYGGRVKAIAFGSAPFDPEKYKNKRAEMWGEMNDWLRDEHLEVDIPDSDSLHADLCASLYHRDTMDRIVLEPKEKLITDVGFSPDEGDALALTFAEPVILYVPPLDSGYHSDSVTGY